MPSQTPRTAQFLVFLNVIFQHTRAIYQSHQLRHKSYEALMEVCQLKTHKKHLLQEKVVPLRQLQ